MKTRIISHPEDTINRVISNNNCIEYVHHNFYNVNIITLTKDIRTALSCSALPWKKNFFSLSSYTLYTTWDSENCSHYIEQYIKDRKRSSYQRDDHISSTLQRYLLDEKFWMGQRCQLEEYPLHTAKISWYAKKGITMAQTFSWK